VWLSALRRPPTAGAGRGATAGAGVLRTARRPVRHRPTSRRPASWAARSPVEPKPPFRSTG
jgi:hypothetical protein